MKFLNLILFVFLSISSYTQSISSSISKDSKFINEPLLRYSLKETRSFFDGSNIIRIENPGIKEVKFYTANYGGQRHAIIIRKFDEKGNEILVNELEGGKKNFGPLSAATIEFNNKILLFYAHFEDKDSMKLYFSQIDKTDLSLKNTTLLFSYSQANAGLLGLGKLLGRQILLRKSPDESKLLVGVRGEGKEYHTCIIDKNLSVIQKKTSTPSIEKDENAIDGILENNGNRILLFADMVETTGQDQFSFTEFYKAKNSLLIQKLDGTEKFIEYNSINNGIKPCNIAFKTTRDAKTYMFGDYKNKSGIEGVWLSSIETNALNVADPVLYPYTNDIRTMFDNLGFDLGNKEKFLKGSFSMVEFDDGSLAICGHTISPYYGGSSSRGATPVGFFGGPIIAAFIEKGSRQCKFFIQPRKMNDPHIGENFYLPYKDKLVIIYNDFTNNLLRDSVQAAGGKLKKDDNSTLSPGYVIVKKDGTLERKKLIVNRRELENELNPGAVVKMGGNKLVIPSRHYDEKKYEHPIAILIIE